MKPALKLYNKLRKPSQMWSKLVEIHVR